MEYGDYYEDSVYETEDYIHGEIAINVDYSYMDF